MTFDPKIRGPQNPAARPATGSRPAVVPIVPAKEVTSGTLRALGYADASEFEANRSADKLAEGRKVVGGVADDSVGRKTVGGVADDSVGRKTVGGVADDSVGRKTAGGVADDSVGRKTTGGVADDSVGRKTTGGVADDSVGRKTNGGVADDSVGFEAVRDSLVGPDTNPDRIALRDAIFDRMESPRYLDGVTSKISDVVNSHVLASPGFKALTTSGQSMLKSVMGHLKDDGMRLLGALVDQNPQALSDKDSTGQTLLSNLSKLATQPLNSLFSGVTDTTQLLTSTLRDIVNPNRIDQGDAPTCTVTSMQFELVAEDPAEYVRLMAGLTGGSGAARMQLGGMLTAQAHDGDVAAREGRSVSQSIFQTAAMEYANGKASDFDPLAGKSTNLDTGESFRGLKPAMQSQILRQLFGTNYRTQTFYKESEGAKVLATLQGYDSRANLNRPVILDIDQGNINHAVTLESVKDGQVIFRDPYGVMRSMPDTLFAKVVVAVHTPADMVVG